MAGIMQFEPVGILARFVRVLQNSVVGCHNLVYHQRSDEPIFGKQGKIGPIDAGNTIQIAFAQGTGASLIQPILG